MEVVNLLNFLNKSRSLYALDCATYSKSLLNLLNAIQEDEQFIRRVDLGVVYVSQRTLDQFTIVDGLGRFLSLSLLLHAVCECYKKTSSQNDKAIKTIRTKYLLNGSKTKLRLAEKDQVIYDKIIFNEKLSGKEKETPIFLLLHKLWAQIKEENLQAANIFRMLDKMFITIVNTEEVCQRDLYYTLNKERRDLDQLVLIESYLKNLGLQTQWELIKSIYDNSKRDLTRFFKDFFVTKFNFREFEESRFYEFFINYFETMIQYMSDESLMAKIKHSAELYKDILNVDFENTNIKKMMVQIKIHKGEDTYAYLLSIYEDFIDGNISETTLLEILKTIDEYLKNRLHNPSDVGFNELIKYLNAFITCK